MLSYKSELLHVHVQQPNITRVATSQHLLRHLEERDDESSLSPMAVLPNSPKAALRTYFRVAVARKS
jgi:hypothetical protein